MHVAPQVFSPNIQCASALLNVTLRSLVLATQGVQKEEASESSKEVEVRVIGLVLVI